MKLSEKILNMEESRTVQFTPLLEKMRKAGKRIYDFAVGEPEFDTPLPIIESTKKALDNQHTRYGPVAGLPALRSRLAEKFEGYDADNIIVSNGSKQTLYSIFQVICDSGDEVILPRPYWVSLAEQIKLAGAVPVLVNTIDHQLDLPAIEQAFTKKTRAIVINSPNNPTGAVYPQSDLKQVVRLAHERDVYLISDEAYDQFVYDDPNPVGLFEHRIDAEKMIITRSFSKHFNMTGFRIGYAAASRRIAGAMARFQSHSTGNVCTFAQYGALAAVSMDEGIVAGRKAELRKKRDLTYRAVVDLFPCVRPQGAFYIFPNVSKYLFKGETAGTFSADLLEKTGVAVVPGEAFGEDGHIRISYAVPEPVLIEGLEKLAKFLDNRRQ